jgi:hypothetical protein
MLLFLVRKLITLSNTFPAKARSSVNGKFERLVYADDQIVLAANVHMTPHDMASSIRYYGSDLVQLPPSESVSLFVRIQFPCGAMPPLFTPGPASHNNHAL